MVRAEDRCKKGRFRARNVAACISSAAPNKSLELTRLSGGLGGFREPAVEASGESWRARAAVQLSSAR
jgi:hypothetical protein